MTSCTYPFEGTTVIVTGGGTGIGRAIARAFLDNGANVVVSGRRLDKLCEAIQDYPTERVMAVENDIADPTAAVELIDKTKSWFGAIDVVVSNAGTYVNGDFEDIDQATWEHLCAVNIDGLFHLAQAALPELRKSKGTLIATASVSGLNGDWGQSIYNASKHAVVGFIRSLALDYGQYGVRINAVAPAFTYTDLTAGMADTPEQAAPFLNRIPLGRAALPEDIAPAVLFLASKDAAYITGVVLPVDGGTSASTGQPHVA